MAEQRYKIYEQLGSGGNGAVFRAYDTQLKRWVAIKRLLSASEISEDDATAAELRREADTLAQLRNANIVTIFDVASDAEGLFIVMELLEGPDLADATQHGPLMLDDFKQLAEQTLEALLAAHQLRVLHRDLKPENIKVERLPGGRFQAKIIDFGLARAGLGARKQTEDQAGSVMGSIYYMAPEQLSREPTDVRTDIYALGCVFYEALAARKAFDGKSVTEVIDKHLDHDVVPLNVLCPHLPQWLTYWVMRLMACKPEDRPANAQQAIEEFRAWEKLPPAPNMMPWMPMNYGYGYAPQGPQYGTGAVPTQTTGYYAPHATSSSVPVSPQAEQQAVPYARPVTSHSVPVSRPVGPQRPAPGPVPQNVAEGKSKTGLIIGGAVAAVAVAGFFLMSGSKPKAGGTVTVAVTSGIDVGGTRDKLFPADRAYIPPDLIRVVHFIAKVATRGYNGTSVSSKNDSNSPVAMWDDLAPRGENNPLVSLGTNPDTSPQRVKWTTADGLVKGDRTALQFTSKAGKTVSMRLYQGDKHKDAFPFGTPTPPFAVGMTIGVVFQPGGQLPCRVARIASPDGKSFVTLRVLASKNIEAEIESPGGKARLTSNGVDGNLPSMAIILWNSETDEVQMRTRDAKGAGHKATAKVPSPQGPLYDLQLGGAPDTPEQFNGFIAECCVYATAQKDDQCSLWEKDLRDQYFQSPASKPLKERLATKLPVIDNKDNKWKLSANPNPGSDPAKNAADGNLGSRWKTGRSMKPGDWFKVELAGETELGGLVLDAISTTDYPRGYVVETSPDDKTWAKALEGKATAAQTELIFPSPAKCRFVRITQTASDGANWSIGEMLLLKAR